MEKPMGEPKRETKNISIEGSISRLNNAVSQLQDFVARVKKGNPPVLTTEENKETQPPPSLQTTLDTTSKKLEVIRDSILTSIGELDASLF